MSLLWADIPSGSEGLYGGVKAYMTNGIWAELQGSAVELIEDPDPNITGKVLSFGLLDGGAGGATRYLLPGAVSTAGIATRIWLNNIPASAGSVPFIHQYRNSLNVITVFIIVNTAGGIGAYSYDGATSTLLGQTAGPVITANAWRHVESKVFFDNSAGTVEVRVEGVVVLDLDTLDTGSAQCAQVAIGTQPNFGPSFIMPTGMKDVIFWDGLGSQNNNFFGPLGVYCLRPNADVSSGWSRTSGSTDWELLDEAPPDDAGYIYAGDPPPAPAIVGVTNLPDDIVSVRGVISVVRAEKSDGGDGNLQVSMSPNGTDWDDGADNPMSTAFTYYYDVSEVSPDTTDPWTPVEVNAMEVKLNRTV
ncbi:MAG: hypothetical protein AB7O49_10160 [Sphingomonadales bacterium]